MGWGLWYGSGPWGACIGNGPDKNPPTISLQSPTPGSTSIPADAAITFRLSDDLSGVDLGSIFVTVQQGSLPIQIAFQNGWFAPQFKGSEAFLSANTTNGFDIILDPVTAWVAGAVITISVQATDAECNSITFTWTFQTTPPFGCVV
jgi:hypothetical protein